MSEIQINDTNAIAEAAFYLWLDEGQPHGRDQEFWLRAEQTLNAAIAKPRTRRAPAKKAAAPKKATAKTATKKPAVKASEKSSAKTTAKKPAARKSATKAAAKA